MKTAIEAVVLFQMRGTATANTATSTPQITSNAMIRAAAAAYPLTVTDAVLALDDDAPMRADARRNLALVLAAAGELFAEEGGNVSMEAIAKRAGIGVGTIYRRFPTKAALGEAVILHHLREIRDAIEAAAALAGPEHAFTAALNTFVEEASRRFDMREALAAVGVDVKEVGGPVFTEIKTFLGSLLAGSQAAGSIRPDVTVDDVFGLVGGACMAGGEHDGPTALRLFSLIADGLRVQPNSA